MAFHIQRPSALNASKTVYFDGDAHWSDDYSKRKSYDTKSAAEAIINATSTCITGTRTGAGFQGATAVSD